MTNLSLVSGTVFWAGRGMKDDYAGSGMKWEAIGEGGIEAV